MESHGYRLGRAGLLTALLAAVLVVAGCEKGGGGEGTGSGAAPAAQQGAQQGGQHAGGQQAAAQHLGGESFSIGAGFTPMTLSGRSGGSTDASSHGPDCVGNIGSSPDHTMTVTSAVAASISVTAEADTTLVVLGPGGPYCNDDTDGLNPRVTATFQPGSYQVFVGNYSSDEGPTPYTLSVGPPPAGTGMMPPNMPSMPPNMQMPPTPPPTMPPGPPPAMPPGPPPTMPPGPPPTSAPSGH